MGPGVNDQLVPLKYKLQHGDIVDIITKKNQQPKRAWLQIVKTSRARARIRHWLRKEEKEKALLLGREICERELKKHDTTLKRLLKSGHFRIMMKELGCHSLDDMLVKVGSGAITVHHLLQALIPDELREEEAKRKEEQLEKIRQHGEQKVNKTGQDVFDIDGVDNMLVKVSQCCKPIPGDEIIGFITMGRGISIHKVDCVNLKSTDPQRWMSVTWSGAIKTMHRSEILIRAENRKNLLADISSAIGHDDADIVSLNARTTSDNVAELDVILEVTDLKHLQTLQQHLMQLPEIIDVLRR